MRISDPRTFGGLHLTTKEYVDALLKGSQTTLGQNGFAYLDGAGKVDPSLMPPLAISDIFVKTVTTADISKDLVALVKEAVAANTDITGVERGDIVILTPGDGVTVDQAAGKCGTYIFTTEVADKASIVADNFVSVYVPGGSVTTVNAVPAVNGNVTLNLENLDDVEAENVTAVKALSGDATNVAYAGAQLAKLFEVTAVDVKVTTLTGNVTTAEGKIDEISGKVGVNEADIAKLSAAKYIINVENFDTDPVNPVEAAIYVANDGQTKAYVGGKWIAISIEATDSIATGADADLATVKAVKDYVGGVETSLTDAVTAEQARAEGAETTLDGKIAAEKARAEGVEDTLSGSIATTNANVAPLTANAIGISSVSYTWQASDKDENGVYSTTIPGHVIQVCDKDGWVIPGIKFNGTNTIVTVQMDPVSAVFDETETWTFYVASLASTMPIV